jgi:DNA-3-methyladenine glycosylase II
MKVDFMEMIETFNETNFKFYCNLLAKQDDDLKLIIDTHGYPPLFRRSPTFETLLHIILEQQVSLASAKAALNKLKEKIGIVLPEKLLLLTDIELRACYFSRQKIIYTKDLANAIINKQLNLNELIQLPDETVKSELKKIKGIGDWTTDVYMMMAMQRINLFPVGDIALVNSMKTIKALPKQTGKETLLLIAEKWSPYRTVAAFLIWHAYIKKRGIKL